MAFRIGGPVPESDISVSRAGPQKWAAGVSCLLGVQNLLHHPCLIAVPDVSHGELWSDLSSWIGFGLNEGSFGMLKQSVLKLTCTAQKMPRLFLNPQQLLHVSKS